jgi:uncharacterized protein (AIM24 family)
MAKIQLGRSSAQILGKTAPAADIRLAEGDGVFFAQANLLWQEPVVEISAMSLRGGWDRVRGGLPVVMLQAVGPGTVSLSHDAPGELIVVPIQAGSAVDVREHHMVAATLGLGFDWSDTGIWFSTSGSRGTGQTGGAGLLKMGLDMAGLSDMAGLGDMGEGSDSRDEIEYHYPAGRYIDRFSAVDRPGAIFVQAGGNVFLRDLAEQESLLVKPPALLYKDPTVAMQMHVEFPHSGMKFWRSWGNRYLWLRVWGPGRVALQSSYDRLEDPGTDFRDSCAYSQQVW